MSRSTPSFIFDLDGTLIDSVYQHVLAWHDALTAVGIDLAVWRIHRRIGMSGGLFTNMLVRETGADIDQATFDELPRLHANAYLERADSVRPLSGAQALLNHLQERGMPWAIATSGRMETARSAFDMLGIDPEEQVIITRDLVTHAKPDPDLFLAAADQLGIDPHNAVVVGDSIWDILAARRAGALSVGLLAGGYGQDELERAGAYRVYADPQDLLHHIDEMGGR